MTILALHSWGVTLFLIYFMFFPQTAQARITPEDIVQTKRETYEKKVVTYSLDSQQKLTKLAEKIAFYNHQRTGEMDKVMETQAAILDEYERRNPAKNKAGIKKARYWITYAHEAVAYQAAKIYILDLSSEVNIKNDALSLINLFSSELKSTRLKVLNSKKTLEEVIDK